MRTITGPLPVGAVGPYHQRVTTPVSVRRSRSIDAPVEVVFEATLSLPLPQLYSRRFGPMPPIVAVHDQQGNFDVPGQTRVFDTADGGAMHEELLAIDVPHRFTNRLVVLKGPFRPLVRTIEETWSFRTVGGGTEATWEWNLVPRSALTRPLAWLVARLWLGYARGVQQQLADEVAGSASR
jgi:hypothetical protein